MLDDFGLTAPCSYNASIWGPSGNITINGTLTYDNNGTDTATTLTKRGIGAGNQSGVDLNAPPYAIHNGTRDMKQHLASFTHSATTVPQRSAPSGQVP